MNSILIKDINMMIKMETLIGLLYLNMKVINILYTLYIFLILILILKFKINLQWKVWNSY